MSEPCLLLLIFLLRAEPGRFEACHELVQQMQHAQHAPGWSYRPCRNACSKTFFAEGFVGEAFWTWKPILANSLYSDQRLQNHIVYWFGSVSDMSRIKMDMSTGMASPWPSREVGCETVICSRSSRFWCAWRARRAARPAVNACCCSATRTRGRVREKKDTDTWSVRIQGVLN